MQIGFLEVILEKPFFSQFFLLSGTALKVYNEIKYLGHYISSALSDGKDIYCTTKYVGS